VQPWAWFETCGLRLTVWRGGVEGPGHSTPPPWSRVEANGHVRLKHALPQKGSTFLGTAIALRLTHIIRHGAELLNFPGCCRRASAKSLGRCPKPQFLGVRGGFAGGGGPPPRTPTGGDFARALAAVGGAARWPLKTDAMMRSVIASYGAAGRLSTACVLLWSHPCPIPLRSSCGKLRPRKHQRPTRRGANAIRPRSDRKSQPWPTSMAAVPTAVTSPLPGR